jgi:hypothetical protein
MMARWALVWGWVIARVSETESVTESGKRSRYGCGWGPSAAGLRSGRAWPATASGMRRRMRLSGSATGCDDHAGPIRREYAQSARSFVNGGWSAATWLALRLPVGPHHLLHAERHIWPAAGHARARASGTSWAWMAHCRSSSLRRPEAFAQTRCRAPAQARKRPMQASGWWRAG